jgi:hypothetical protein
VAPRAQRSAVAQPSAPSTQNCQPSALRRAIRSRNSSRLCSCEESAERRDHELTDAKILDASGVKGRQHGSRRCAPEKDIPAMTTTRGAERGGIVFQRFVCWCQAMPQRRRWVTVWPSVSGTLVIHPGLAVGRVRVVRPGHHAPRHDERQDKSKRAHHRDRRRSSSAPSRCLFAGLVGYNHETGAGRAAIMSRQCLRIAASVPLDCAKNYALDLARCRRHEYHRFSVIRQSARLSRCTRVRVAGIILPSS